METHASDASALTRPARSSTGSAARSRRTQCRGPKRLDLDRQTPAAPAAAHTQAARRGGGRRGAAHGAAATVVDPRRIWHGVSYRRRCRTNGSATGRDRPDPAPGARMAVLARVRLGYRPGGARRDRGQARRAPGTDAPPVDSGADDVARQRLLVVS